MHRTLFILVCGLAATSLFADSASGDAVEQFGCKTSRLQAMQLACSDLVLAKQAEVLRGALSTVLLALPYASHLRVIDDFDESMQYIEFVCMNDKHRNKTKQVKACIKEEFDFITYVYKSYPKRVGSYVIFPRTKQSVLAVDEAEYEKYKLPISFATQKLVYPEIETAGLQGESLETAIAMNEWLKPEARVGANYEDASETYTADFITPDILAKTFNQYLYGHGAAHGITSENYAYWHLGLGRQLGPSDIFDGEAWASVLADIGFAHLKGQLGSILHTDVTPERLRGNIAKIENWVLTKEGLRLTFHEYEVTAYVFGRPSVFITWEDLRSLTTSWWRVEIGIDSVGDGADYVEADDLPN